MTLRHKLAELVADDRGGEVLEYALVMGMIALIAIGPMQAVGQKIVQYWRALDQGLGL
jgi:Flp pilus assembly pilin Flp